MKQIKWTEKQKQFIYENYKGIGNKELTDVFNKKFGTNIVNQIKYFKRNHKLDSGLNGQFIKGHKTFNKGKKWDEYMPKQSQINCKKTTFKKGNIPPNHRQVGEERINVDGYIEIKVSEPNKWELKHRYIYKKHYGSIPKGYKVIFLDGNKTNLNINNLKAISSHEELIMNEYGLRYGKKELTESASIVAQLELKRRELKNERL
jgi:hypothetical protein